MGEVPRGWEEFQGVGRSSKESGKVPRSWEKFQVVGKSSKELGEVPRSCGNLQRALKILKNNEGTTCSNTFRPHLNNIPYTHISPESKYHI